MNAQYNFKGIDTALTHLSGTRKAIQDVAFIRQYDFKVPKPINENFVLMEQGIDRAISNLELEIILYRRFVEDMQELQK